jgi:hypothetical protein
VFAVASRKVLLGPIHHHVLPAGGVGIICLDCVLDVFGHDIDLAALHHDDDPLACVVCGL